MAFVKYVGGDAATRARVRLTVTYFLPDQRAFDCRAHWVRCDIIALQAEQILADLPPKLEGLLDDESAIDDYGLCSTGVPGTDNSTMVMCNQPHTYRAIAALRLGSTNEGYPGEHVTNVDGKQRCEDLIIDLLDEESGFTFSWTFPTPADWQEGQRFGYCWNKTVGLSPSRGIIGGVMKLLGVGCRNVRALSHGVWERRGRRRRVIGRDLPRPHAHRDQPTARHPPNHHDAPHDQHHHDEPELASRPQVGNCYNTSTETVPRPARRVVPDRLHPPSYGRDVRSLPRQPLAAPQRDRQGLARLPAPIPAVRRRLRHDLQARPRADPAQRATKSTPGRTGSAATSS